MQNNLKWEISSCSGALCCKDNLCHNRAASPFSVSGKLSSLLFFLEMRYSKAIVTFKEMAEGFFVM